MKVRLFVSRSGPEGAFAPGDVIEVSDQEAIRMADAGQCEIVRSAKAEKTTRNLRAEKAVK